MSTALTRFSRRHNSLRPGRTLLTLLSVVIGVAAVTSVDMFSQSIRRANEHMFEVVNGKSALEITGPGNASLPYDLLAKIEEVRGVEAAVPVIQRVCTLFAGEAENNQKTRLYALGVDPARDSALRDHEILEGRFVVSGEEAVLEHSFAQAMHVKVGDEIRLLGGRTRQTLTVVGLLKTTSHARTSSGSMLFLPLDKAQEMFLRGKKEFDTAQVVVSDDITPESLLEKIQKLLPPGFTVHKPANRAAVLSQTMNSTERGLDVSSKFVVLLGAFIVFNTFLMNVGERRQQLAILRAIGTTRSQIGYMLLREGMILGIAGTLLGLLIGWQGTMLAAQALSEVMNVQLPSPQLTWTMATKAIAFGLGMSLLGVTYPAWKAAQLTPLEGMRAIAQEDLQAGSSLGVIVGWSMVLVAVGILKKTFEGSWHMDRGTDAAIMLLIGLVFLASPLIGPASTWLAYRMKPYWGPLALLAQRQVTRHHTRTALTAGVLFIAASTGLGMSFSILDAVEDIRSWYKQAIVGDFFVRAMLPDFATGLAAEMPEDVGVELAAIEGIESLDAARFVKSKANGVECLVAARKFPTPEDLSFDLVEGDAAKLFDRLHAGEVVVSTVLAQKANIHLHDELQLETNSGVQKMKVAAIINEYAFGGLALWMSMKTGEKTLNISGVDAYVVRVQPGRIDAVQQALEKICQKNGLLLHSFRDIRKTVDGIIAGTDYGLWVLVGVGFIVASFGVVNTLTMNVLEQTRELGLLRMVAMTREQVRQLIIAQALILGLLGLIPGVLFGCLVAYIMNWAASITLAHPIEFAFHPWVLVATFVGGLALVLMAAFIPALRAARINMIQALHFE
jgi:putative ABC transport system permease protein